MLLCDIDGTLITTQFTGDPEKNRFCHSIKSVFGIDVMYNRSRYNGWTDYQILWEMVKPFGIKQSELDQNIDKIAEMMIEGVENTGIAKTIFCIIPGVRKFLKQIEKLPINKGIFTGNLEKVGKWKMELNNINAFFNFGLYGDHMKNKSEILERKLPQFIRSKPEKIEYANCCVIGDTAEDIKAGKHIGAKTIGVLTSSYSTKLELGAAYPDLIVSSLLDPEVIDLLLQ